MSVRDRTVTAALALGSAFLAFLAMVWFTAPSADARAAVLALPGQSALVKIADSGPDANNPMGLCNGIGGVPLAFQDKFDFSKWEDLLQHDVARASAFSMRWYRHNTIVFPYFDQHSLETAGWDFTRQDDLVRRVQASGADILLGIGRTQGNASCTNERSVWQDTSYVPRTDAERAAWNAYVRRVVERYDGDGKDDAPGLLRPIRWWELDNEVDLHYAHCLQVGKDWESPEDYYALLRLTREAMRQADPESRLLPGLSSTRTDRQAFTTDQYFERLFAVDGGNAANLVDALNLHDYSRSVDDMVVRVDWLRKVAGKPLPVWLTEFGLPSNEAAHPGWTWDRQADEMVRFTLRLLSTGKVGKVFWYTLEDAPVRTSDPRWRAFGTSGLYSCEGGPAVAEEIAPGRGRPGGAEGDRPPRGRLGDGQGRQFGSRGGGASFGGPHPAVDPDVACPQRNPKPSGIAFARLTELLSGMERVEALPVGDAYRIHRRGAPDVVVAWSGTTRRTVALKDLVGRNAATLFAQDGDPKSGPAPGVPTVGEITLTSRPVFLVLDR